MQTDQATGDELTATELDLAEALDHTRPSTRATRPGRKRRNRGGRPSRLTIETALKLGQALWAGQSIEIAAQSARVRVSSVYRWAARGRSGDPRFATLAAVTRSKGSDRAWKGWDLGSLRGAF